MSRAAVAVRRARIHDTRGDALAARIRVAQLFAAADVSTGLPRGSLLVVRALADPLPGALGAERHGLRPPYVWERALRESLLEIARTAARPAHGAVPAGALAVFFADEAELLACLVCEVAQGTADTSWWWAGVVPTGLPPRVALARALAERVAAVPAAFERLATAGALARVGALLDAVTARAVAAAVAERFGLTLADDASADATPVGRPGPAAKRGASVRELTAAIAAIAPEAAALPAPLQTRRLVALALAVRRAPALARAPLFTHALAAAVPAGDARLVERIAARPDEPQATPRLPTRPEASATSPPAAERPEPTTPTRPTFELRSPSTVVATFGLQTEPAAPPDVPGLLIPGPEAVQSVATELGGVLFLANVAIALGLYGDFTQPREPGVGVDFWRFLSLLGARLLARRPQRRDPIWALLRDLAGPDAMEDPDIDRLVAEAGRRTRARLRASRVTVDALLRRPACIAVTDTRVDAVFELASHPLEIRVAGLDRDPGFVPAAVRTIAFHFE